MRQRFFLGPLQACLIHCDVGQGGELAGFHQGGLNVGDSEQPPLDVGHALDDLSLALVTPGEAGEVGIAVALVFFAVFLGQERVLCREPMTEGIAGGAGFSFGSDRSGGKLCVGLIGD